MTTITGSVDRIVFRNADSGFCVARLTLVDGGKAPAATTIVGTLPDIRTGEMLRLSGEWQVHPVHGRNFRVERFEQELPTSVEGIERYLASGAIRGVGPVTAARIVEAFGDRAIPVIDEQPELLHRVEGISHKRADIIRTSWEEQKKVRDLMMFLQEFGVSVALAARIREAYGDEAVEVIKRDPYELARDVRGIGFRTADLVARQVGVSRSAPSRLVAGLRYVLSQATDEGHVYLPRPELLQRAGTVLDCRRAQLEPALLELLRREDATVNGDDVYLTPFYRAETGVARLIHRLRATPSALTLDPRTDARAVAEAAGAREGLALAPKQIEAVQQALSQKVSIVTGGPGTGKTSTLRTIITALESLDLTYCLCAPTGRAAKRVAETTGRRASTIHRLLEYQQATGTFNYSTGTPLPFDFVIADEVSMLDLLLAYHLLKAVAPESHLVLVGDVDQLPAVGPGNVLADLLASEQVPSVVLTDLFRQARGSQIVVAAHAIRQGKMPAIGNEPDGDLFFIRAREEQDVVSTIKELLAARIPRRFSLNPVDDVQVISPMHDGPAGVTNLNAELQALLNPGAAGKPEMIRGSRAFRLGDKVMQIRNNYDRDVYNGDVGRVTGVDLEEQRLVVRFGSGAAAQVVAYDPADLDELVLAYAVSVHKAQGSEAPCIVMPLIPRHHILLQRNLLYTAVTRARQVCVLVGSDRAMQAAVRADLRDRRNSRLSQRLRVPSEDALQIDLL